MSFLVSRICHITKSLHNLASAMKFMHFNHFARPCSSTTIIQNKNDHKSRDSLTVDNITSKTSSDQLMENVPQKWTEKYLSNFKKEQEEQIFRFSDGTPMPVENRSLSRGLFMDRFVKDFMIYPEFNEKDDYDFVKSYADNLSHEFDKNVHSRDIDDDRMLPDQVIATLKKSGLFGASVSKDFGGLQMNYKDVAIVWEVLSKDWSVYSFLSMHHLVCELIAKYGTIDQKETFLPRLASGESLGTVCLFEDSFNALDFNNMKTDVRAYPKIKLCGEKGCVFNADRADVLLVFAKNHLPAAEKIDNMTCYLIDLQNEKLKDHVRLLKREDTLGLRGLSIGRLSFDDVPICEDMVLGMDQEAYRMAMDVVCSNKFSYGAAVVGFLRRLIDELVAYCNQTLYSEQYMADDRAVQKIISDLSMATFLLESGTYYIAGLVDEEMTVNVDLENAIIHRYANRCLRQAIDSMLQISGSRAIRGQFHFERMIRDISTVMAFGPHDVDITEQIALGAVTAWAYESSEILAKIRNPLENWRGARKFRSDYSIKAPKMVHFIAEHAHPTLEEACTALERNLSRMQSVMKLLLDRVGKQVDGHFETLDKISQIVETNFFSLATISRSSRSYCTGVRNADIEISWTLLYCTSQAIIVTNVMDELYSAYNMGMFNPSTEKIGEVILKLGGYKIENPLEKVL